MHEGTLDSQAHPPEGKLVWLAEGRNGGRPSPVRSRVIIAQLSGLHAATAPAGLEGNCCRSLQCWSGSGLGQ